MGKISDFPLEFWIDPVTLNSRGVWKQEAYLWRFHERSTFQPPGVRLSTIQLFEVWMVDFAQGGCEFLDEGDVLQYSGEHLYPVALIPGAKFEAWKTERQAKA